MSIAGGDFDSWLEQGLGKALNGVSGPAPLASQASYHAAYLAGGIGVSFGSSLVSALTSKVAIAGATTALVVGGGTAAAITTAGSSSGGDNSSATGARNGNGVASFVRLCQDEAATSGVHGIGQCVATFARHHGQSEKTETHGNAGGEAHEHESATGARHENENGEGSSGSGKANGAGANGAGHGQAGTHGGAPRR